MIGEVATRSVYLEPIAWTGAPSTCQVLAVAPLLHKLLNAAVDVPAEYDPLGRDGRLIALLVNETDTARVLPLSLPLPCDGKLAAHCRRFLQSPTMRDSRPS